MALGCCPAFSLGSLWEEPALVFSITVQMKDTIWAKENRPQRPVDLEPGNESFLAVHKDVPAGHRHRCPTAVDQGGHIGISQQNNLHILALYQRADVVDACSDRFLLSKE